MSWNSWAERYPSLPPIARWTSKYRMEDYAKAKIWMFKITGAYPQISVVEGRIQEIQKSGGWMDPKNFNYRVKIRIVRWTRTYNGLNTMYGAINYPIFRSGRFVRNALATHLLFRLSGCGIKAWPWGTYRTSWEQSRANIRKMAIARMSGTGPIAPPIHFDPDLWREAAAPAPAPVGIRRARDEAPRGGRKRPRGDVFFTEQE